MKPNKLEFRGEQCVDMFKLIFNVKHRIPIMNICLELLIVVYYRTNNIMASNQN